uniref:Uncharacterized protein n=1 Tax=uncultured Desulfobacterium sp. TaxID=201089 RepID=E1YBS3_9BACT|nr:unknown protein [uncultured Desulfobacterium sp.]
MVNDTVKKPFLNTNVYTETSHWLIFHRDGLYQKAKPM